MAAQEMPPEKGAVEKVMAAFTADLAHRIILEVSKAANYLPVHEQQSVNLAVLWFWVQVREGR
ncbi:hypothetical protein [[Phormidium] sp. ETS-05]|uniref:hypothetical protein n=1 Tax=[Phormidium] sp. ETS-05 TaxID=222819 RepID=UPI0018EF2321|nr:hypothetical protein [[Phormidium] sp. ETS-05]